MRGDVIRERRAEVKRGELQSTMPRVYASEAGVTAVRTVKLAEMEALRRYRRDIGGMEAPRAEGHGDHFGRFAPTHPGVGVRELMGLELNSMIPSKERVAAWTPSLLV